MKFLGTVLLVIDIILQQNITKDLTLQIQKPVYKYSVIFPITFIQNYVLFNIHLATIIFYTYTRKTHYCNTTGDTSTVTRATYSISFIDNISANSSEEFTGKLKSDVPIKKTKKLWSKTLNNFGIIKNLFYELSNIFYNRIYTRNLYYV